MNKEEKIQKYIEQQLKTSELNAKGYVFDVNNKKKPRRDVFKIIEKYFNLFLSNNTSYRWIDLIGLRGTGKTTILQQLYYSKKDLDAYFLILSVDDIVNVLQSNIMEVIQNFEKMIKKSLWELDKPLFIFLDEVQYDKNWGVSLKVIYDKAFKNVFVFSTGSSALLLNTNADIARRVISTKIHPMSFSEFMEIKYNIKVPKNISKKIEEAFFHSNTTKEIFEKLQEIESEIKQIYFKIKPFSFDEYLNYSSLPYVLGLENKEVIFNTISRSVERIIMKDMGNDSGIDNKTLGLVEHILYAVANMDTVNFSNLSQKLGISRTTISDIFSRLEKTELLFRIYPKGSHFKQITNKPSKFLFASPVFRNMYYKKIGSTIDENNSKGKLLEDLIAMYISRIKEKYFPCSLTYDNEVNGADFIFSVGDKKIVIEVGANKNKNKQVVQTMKRIKSNLGIVLSEQETELKFDEKNNIVTVPLRYFILI